MPEKRKPDVNDTLEFLQKVKGELEEEAGVAAIHHICGNAIEEMESAAACLSRAISHIWKQKGRSH